MARKPKCPSILQCEACGELFALILTICKCPDGPTITEKTLSKYR